MSSTDEEPSVDPIWDRTTAPQSPFTTRDVGIGFLILLIGLIVIFGIPILIG